MIIFYFIEIFGVIYVKLIYFPVNLHNKKVVVLLCSTKWRIDLFRLMCYNSMYKGEKYKLKQIKRKEELVCIMLMYL